MSPSLSARIFGFLLRTTGIIRRNYAGGPEFQKSLAKNRAAPTPEPTAKMRAKADVQYQEFQGRPVWHIGPKGGASKAHYLYWHGGGYVYPPTDAHFAYLTNMAEKYGWSITAPLYPLAPEHDAKRVKKWATDFYRDYVEKRAGQMFFMGGDSAGGGLTAALSMMMRDDGSAMPAALILINPWLHAKPEHPDQAAIEPRDGILTLSGIREAGQLYAGDLPIDDPWVSPIFGNWANLPPILAFGGGDDILVTDARTLKQKLPDMDYHELPGMVHDWPIFFFPESRAAQGQMAAFVAAKSN